MVQLDVLSGRKAGTSIVARRFPFEIGRSPELALCLDDPGVFERHLVLSVQRGQGVTLTVGENALATVNHSSVQSTVLRNGDVIEFGAAKLRFTLSPARQRNQSWREILTWFGVGLLCAGQIALIYLFLDWR